MVQCGKTDGCVAINMSPLQGEEHECEMLDLTRYSKFFAKFIAKPGWTYTGPKVHTYCVADIYIFYRYLQELRAIPLSFLLI